MKFSKNGVCSRSKIPTGPVAVPGVTFWTKDDSTLKSSSLVEQLMSTTTAPPLHNCTVCGKVFARATLLTKHQARKRPCVPPVLTPLPPPPLSDFRPHSITINSTLTKDVRQKAGIFLTPRKARELLFETLETLGVSEPTQVLEPSCGTGELLLDAHERWPEAHITGVELNPSLFASIRDQTEDNPNVSLVNKDFLKWSSHIEFDLIIGNPPYFVLPAASTGSTMCLGRPNIYIEFLHKCLTKHLAPNGFFAFILPTSIYNCAYYQPMRDFIATTTIIHHVETLDKPGFYDTAQDTTLIVLQNRVPTVTPSPFLWRASSGTLYISPHAATLTALTAGSKTLHELGFEAITGSVVWNVVKEHLTNDSRNPESKLLIYARNVKNGTLELDNLVGKETKQRIVLPKPKQTLNGPVILVDRGFGNGFKFNSVLIPESVTDFYAENHLNVIMSVLPQSAETKATLVRIQNSFQDPRTGEFVRLFNGNGTVSATNLNTLIPVFM